jgi:hypothetical protein
VNEGSAGFFGENTMTTMVKAKDTNTDPRRVQFDLLPSRLAELDQLMEFCEMSTRKELFDNAMTLFEWAVHEVRAGRAVASYDRKADHVEIVRFPVLDNAARRALAHKPVSLVDTEQDDGAQDPALDERRSAGGATPMRRPMRVAPAT